MSKTNVAVLREQISLFDQAYEQGQPLISDTEYEKKYDELRKLEMVEGTTPDSPTQNIHYSKVEGLETVPHTRKLLSLDKKHDYPSLHQWFEKIGGPMLAQPKIDGLTIDLRYQNGYIIDAVTRGDGEKGDRVLHLVRTIKSIPQKIAFTGYLELRGEVYMPFAAFEQFIGIFANSRAAASGTMRLLDASIAAERGLEFLAFELVEAENQNFGTDYERLLYLESLGFITTDTVICDNWEALQAVLDSYHANRMSLAYPIDGVVIKVDDLAYRKVLGTTAKFPKYGIAYKMPSLEGFTILRDVVWQIGKSGQITPVALYDPLEIDGNVNTRATLHNRAFVIENNVCIGDKIVVARANDVIPQVRKVVVEAREQELLPVEVPVCCPRCGAPLVSIGPKDFCTGTTCPGQMIAKIVHFGSRDALDIDGLGPSITETLFDNGFISDPSDLFMLENHFKAIEQLDGIGFTKATNLIANIEKAKEMPLSKVLYSLAIPRLGRTVSKVLAKLYSMDDLIGVTSGELQKIEGIGPAVSGDIVNWFSNPKNQELLYCLRHAGLSFEKEIIRGGVGESLKGLTIVITGTLSRNRSEYEAMIQAAGGKTSGSVSAKTSYLVAAPGETGTTKYQKAEALGIRIIGESELIAMLNNGNEGGGNIEG